MVQNVIFTFCYCIKRSYIYFFNVKGIYVWESSYHGIPDAEDDNIKFGVQIMPLDLYLKNYPGNVEIYVRKCPENAKSLFTVSKLKKIHDKVHNKPYDLNPIDWFDAYKHIHNNSIITYFVIFFNNN